MRSRSPHKVILGLSLIAVMTLSSSCATEELERYRETMKAVNETLDTANKGMETAERGAKTVKCIRDSAMCLAKGK